MIRHPYVAPRGATHGPCRWLVHDRTYVPVGGDRYALRGRRSYLCLAPRHEHVGA